MGGGSSKPAVKKKAPGGTVSSVDRAMLDLKNARDRLQKYKSKLESEELKLLHRAKQAKEAGNTKTALGLLRLKKYKTVQVDQVENQLLTVLQMVETIDSKQNETQLLTALRTGKDALQKMQQETTVEDVLDLMESIQEQNDVEKEVTEILSGVPSLSVEDEALVEAELEALEAEMLLPTTMDTKPSTDAPDKLPEVPTTKLPELVVPAEKKDEPVKKPARVAVAS
mmetsp:Transcript_11008/g.18244  ORF Transcript_11008/g.18244 Transcript_11008/m.18244 type:complete len:226 (-) Transcript_11008:223-900(-)|eukprot:CAMPEP_0119006682 /NCGR_PEP_ID=MMETSP1176-20130426/2461_1 /TAXON_ID=265551 /ORGANISM="Synedropsis recta cf, Strain CCMP1620" /LENGTH=225 /DNA_ID=CAMNT_0006958637 /DNA_START=103 /DNA_END=780 /DNA_ORIENTATION=-